MFEYLPIHHSENPYPLATTIKVICCVCIFLICIHMCVTPTSIMLTALLALTARRQTLASRFCKACFRKRTCRVATQSCWHTVHDDAWNSNYQFCAFKQTTISTVTRSSKQKWIQYNIFRDFAESKASKDHGFLLCSKQKCQ